MLTRMWLIFSAALLYQVQRYRIEGSYQELNTLIVGADHHNMYKETVITIGIRFRQLLLLLLLLILLLLLFIYRLVHSWVAHWSHLVPCGYLAENRCWSQEWVWHKTSFYINIHASVGECTAIRDTEPPKNATRQHEHELQTQIKKKS